MHSAALKHLKTFSPVVSGANNANTMPLPSHWGAKDLIALFELDKHRTIIDALENPSNHLSPGERRRLGPLDPTTSTQKLPFPTATTVATTIKGALERFWASTAQKVDKYCLPTHMIEKVGLKPEAVLQWTKTVWHSIQEGTAPWLPHDAYLKLMQLNPVADAAAFERFDTIMFDEAQDASPCMASIILRQLQLGRSIIVVGDPYQKIYGFRGAGNDCFDDELYPPTRTCFLTHSFRFGDNIAGIANMLLRALKEPKQVHGVRRHDAVKLAPPTSVLNNPRMPPLPPQKEPFTIIFRKNITLISTAISFCLTHPLHKMYLRLARSITKRTLFANLRAAHALLRYGTQANTGPLADWKNWDTLKEHVSAASKAGDDTPQILVLLVGLEEHLASESFLAHLANLERNVLGDDESDAADVVFTTAHQAKGLEWDRVQVAPDFGPDFKKRGRLCGSKYWREECGLLYVAVTRARKELLVASPITWYAAAEEGVVDVSIAKEEVATCDVCGEQWDTCWGVLELKKATWEEGRFDVVIPTPTSSNTATTITTTPISPSSASTSSSSSSSSSTLSSPATLSPLSQPHLRPPQQPRTTIKACGRCSHVTNQFMCSLQPEAQGYRWRPMACWDAAWQAKYDAESARVQGGLRRRHEEGDWGDDDGGGDDDDGAGGAVVNGVVIGVGAGGGGGGAGLVMEEEEEVEGWWGEKVRV